MLDLGAVVGRVILDTSQFDRGYTLTLRRMTQLGTDAEKSAAGVRSLDDSLVGAAGAADKASTSNTRYSQSTTRAAAAEEKAAAAARLRSDAESRLGVVLTRIAGEDTRVQQATLRQATAQERANIAAGEGNAVFARQASAQASLIGANRALARSQEATTAATGRMSSGFVGALKTAGELGLLIGGIEIAKKAIEFVGAGRDLTTSLNSVQAAAQATDQQMIAVRAQAIGLGKDLTVPRATAVDAAKAIDDLVRSGMTLPRAMAAARSALLLASVSQTDMTLTSRVLGDALDEFRLPATQAAHVASLLGAAATSTAGGLDTVFQALKYSGTRARAAKVPMQDLLASIVDLSKAGLQGTTIGTGLAMMITRLASKSAPTVAALKDLGISAWDAQGRFKGLPFVIQAISDSYKRFGPNSKRFLSDLNSAFGARAANIMAAFAGKGVAGIDRFENRLKGFDLQTAANNMNRGFSAAMGQISKQLTALGIDIYQNLEPALAGAAMWLGTSIPHAVSVLATILAPTAKIVAGTLVGAFRLLVGILGPVADALGHVGHFLADNTFGRGLVTTVLTLWAAFKGYTILRAAAIAVDGFFGTLAQRAVTAGAAVRTAMQRTVTGAGAARIALGGLTAGITFGAMTRGASGAAQAVGALGAAGVGAAQGFAVGGPWGAAIGGAVGLVSSLATSLFGASDASSKVNAEAGTLTGTLNKQTGAITRLTVATQAHNLEQAGALQAAQQLGLNLHDVTLAALGNVGATRRITDSYRAYIAAREKILSQPMTEKSDAELGKLNDLIPVWGKVADSVAIGKSATDKASGAFVRVTTATKGATTATQYHNTVVTKDMIATMNLKQQTDLLKGALGGIARQLNNAAAAVAWQQSLNDLTATFKQNKGAIEGHSTAALADKSALIGDMQTVVQHAQAMQKNGASVQSVTGYITRQYGELRQHAVAAGADGKQIDALAKKLGVFPRSIKSKLTIDPTEALNAVAQVRVAVTNLPSGNFSLRSNGSLVRGSLAAGGVVHGPGTGTSDTAGVYALSNGEAVIPAKAVSRHPEVIHRLIREGRGRAGGTVLGAIESQVKDPRLALAMAMAPFLEGGGRSPLGSGGWGVGDYGTSFGPYQIHLPAHPGVTQAEALDPAFAVRYMLPAYRAALHAASAALWKSDPVRAAEQVIYAAERPSQNYYATHGTGGVNSAYQAASSAIGGGSYTGGGGGGGGVGPVTKVNGGWQFGSTVYASKRAAENAQRRAEASGSSDYKQKIHAEIVGAHNTARAGNQLGRMLGRDITLDRHGNIHGSTVSVGDIRSQLQTLGGDLRDAGASKKFIDRIKAEGGAILDAARSRNKAAAELQRAHDRLVKARAKEHSDFQSFRSARSGIFDIASAGTDPVTGKVTAGSILAQQRQAISRLHEWNHDLRHLAPLLPDGYFRQLENQSPDQALPELRALMSMNPGQLRTLRRQAGELRSLSGQGANFGATHLDQHAINVARRQERHDANVEKRREKHLEHLFDKLGRELGHLTVAGTAELDYRKGTLVFQLERDQHHVATHRRGRPKASG